MEQRILVERLQARMKHLNTNATQVALAAKLGKTAVRDIVAGKSKKPTMDTIARIARVLECSIGYLIDESYDPNGPAPVKSTELITGTVHEVTELGVFKRNTSPAGKTEVPVLSHSGYAQHHLKAYAVGDDAMAGLGILKGDILSVAAPYGDGAIDLIDGAVIVCSRTIIPPTVTEVSLRQVSVKDGEISLSSMPLDGEPDVVTIESRPAGFPENLHMASDGNGVTIEGRVVWIIRDLG